MHVQTPTRFFEVAEANAQVGELAELFAQVLQLRAQIKPLAARADTDLSRRSTADLNRDRAALQGLVETLEEAVREIAALGCVIRDLSVGLVDWPALHEGRPVWLCWQYGEAEVGYWHDINAGYAGRRPVSELRPTPLGQLPRAEVRPRKVDLLDE